MDLKKIFKEMLIILAVSAILGFSYNLIRETPVPIMPRTASENQFTNVFLFEWTDQLPLNKDFTKTVTKEQIEMASMDPRFVIIDARRPDQFDVGRIGESFNIFPYDDESVYMDKLYSLPPDKVIIVYCDGGACDLSHHVAEDLSFNGFESVFIYKGGWEEWVGETQN